MFELYDSLQQKNLMLQILLKPLIESLFRVRIDTIKISTSSVKLREKNIKFHCKMVQKLQVL